MIHAYRETYTRLAQKNLAIFLDYSVNVLKLDIKDVWKAFLDSPISKRFMEGDPFVLAGRSGIEMVFDVLQRDNDNYVEYPIFDGRSEEYWLGYYLAYFQWETNVSFHTLDEYISINEMLSMYHPYHEVDVTSFVDELIRRLNERKGCTNLEIIRRKREMTRNELSIVTGVNARTIERYEQRLININSAGVETILSLSQALFVNPLELLEKELRKK